jgi:formate hydrogenlyase subunit 3/multisubunit Na+/H+ antiporter MnhD subunit
MRKKTLLLAGLLLLSSMGVSAATHDISEVIDIMKEPVRAVTGLMIFAFYVAGIALIIGGVMQYRIHRRTPKQVPLTTPIFYWIFGFILILIPYLTTLYDTANLMSSVPTPFDRSDLSPEHGEIEGLIPPSEKKNNWYQAVDPEHIEYPGLDEEELERE